MYTVEVDQPTGRVTSFKQAYLLNNKLFTIQLNCNLKKNKPCIDHLREFNKRYENSGEKDKRARFLISSE